MNERIEQLSTQAVNYARENFGTDFVLFYKLWQEKFAELIVRECGQCLNSPEFIGRSDLDWSMVLNEHFGVEQ